MHYRGSKIKYQFVREVAILLSSSVMPYTLTEYYMYTLTAGASFTNWENEKRHARDLMNQRALRCLIPMNHQLTPTEQPGEML